MKYYCFKPWRSSIRKVSRKKTALGIWEKPEKIYLAKSLANRLYVKKTFYTLSIEEGSSFM